MTTEYIFAEGDNYKGALRNGLNILNLPEDRVEIEVLDERKGTLFKKGLVKLKLTPIVANDKIDNEKDECIDSPILNKFYLDYRPDGVYLTVTNSSNISIGTLLDYLTNKQVKDYDYEKIKQCIETKKGVAEKIAPFQDEFLIDSTLEIGVSKDKLEATIVLTEPSGGKMLSVAEIIDSLNKNSIKFGINIQDIEKVLKDRIFNQPVVVARGNRPISGKDGEIIYSICNEIEGIKPTIDENGKTDYKNLNRIRNVNKGTLLMEIKAASEGINGVDIYGNEIPAKKGKEVIVKKGKHVVESQDMLKLYAVKDGEVHFVDGTICVEEILNIDGDIDNETGNIKFNGKINIKGSVKSGFKVEADGDIEVWGVVEGAELISKGDIILHRGVQGNNQAYIKSDGNLKVKYLENASVKCEGSIEADAILHSNITTKTKVIALGKKGLIVGGHIKAGQEIRAKVIGSHMGTITKLEVGIDPEEKKHHDDLNYQLLDVQKNIESAKKAIELLDKISKKQKLTNDKQDLLIKSVKTYNVLRAKYDLINNELGALSAKFKDSNNGKIHAISIIYPGVKVVIGSSSRQIYDEASSCTLSIRNAEIKVDPLEK